jgi:hypothetical protein
VGVVTSDVGSTGNGERRVELWGEVKCKGFEMDLVSRLRPEVHHFL